jgi:hypothetical protein
MDKRLWKVENYLDFLEARRSLLAEAANKFLDSLLAGEVPATDVVESVFEKPISDLPGHIESQTEEETLDEVNQWMAQHFLPEGEYSYELVDSKTGDSLAYLDLAWPEGVQEKYSTPVALLIGEEDKTLEMANKAGYRCFSSVEDFKKYVHDDIIGPNNGK